MIFDAPVQFEAALRNRAVRQLLPMDLSAREYQKLSRDLKNLSVFSARVTEADFLQRLNELVKRIVGGPTEEDFERRARGEAPLLMDLAQARLELKQYLDSIGYQPLDPDDAGTIKDLRSDRRINLMLETNADQATNHGVWEAGQNRVTLDLWPAQELFRLIDSREKRDWLMRFRLAGEATGRAIGDGWTITPEGRMIALKNHPLWDNLGDPALFSDGLHNPYPPFAFNSGMDVRDIAREEALSIGILAADDPSPAPVERGLADSVGMSAARFDEELQQALADDPDLELANGVLRLKAA